MNEIALLAAFVAVLLFLARVLYVVLRSAGRYGEQSDEQDRRFK